MKRIAVVVACVGALVASASCDKGTLGTPAGGGRTGTLDGVGGAAFPPGRAGMGGFVGEGIGGDFAGVGDIGAGGGTGFGGRGGPGGTGFTSCPSMPTPACGVTACGNGTVDRCQVPTGPGCIITSQYEECDGDQFGGDSCARRGYGSGKLTCTSACTIDGTTCAECLPVGSAIVSCGPAPIAFPYLAAFAMAATDPEVGIAQVDSNITTY